MKSQDFTTTVVLDAIPADIFKAVNNVRQWWSENIDGDTGKLNSEFLYHYEDVHRAKIRVTELLPDKKVAWHVVDNYFKFTEDESEWKDTSIIFEISEKEGKTQLKFTHEGLVPEYECFQICHDAWTHYVQGSLKDLIMKGKGYPTPKATDEAEPHNQQIEAEQTDLKSIFHRLLIESPVETVYRALTMQEGLAGWWTPHTIAKPEVGSVSRFTFSPDYYKEMRVEELKPYSKVKWFCVHAYEEWIGTTITFSLEAHQKGCVLSFHHDNWKGYTTEFASCSYDWALFLRSLKLLCETGKGLPYPEFNR
jgi:uncharacterized protein YndB with AHSA1/START domain